MTTHATNYTTALAQLADVARAAPGPQVIYKRRRASTAHADIDGIARVPTQPLTAKPVSASRALETTDAPLRNQPSTNVEPFEEDPDDPETALRHLKQLEMECWAGFHMAKKAAKPSAMAMLGFMDQIRRILETQQKIRAEMKKKAPIVPMHEWTALSDRIIAALEPFPEAKAAVVAAITKEAR
jgi:hypothetical protein